MIYGRQDAKEELNNHITSASWQQTSPLPSNASPFSSDQLVGLQVFPLTIAIGLIILQIGVTLQTIWFIHWRSDFHDIPWNNHLSSQSYQHCVPYYPFIYHYIHLPSLNSSILFQIGTSIPQ